MKRAEREIIHEQVDYENERFRIRKYDILEKNGQQGLYYTIEKKDAVYVVAMTKQNEIYLLKENRFPIDRIMTNIPAGAIEKEHSILDNAKKELREETGLKAQNWEELGIFIVDPGSQSTTIYAFLATDLDESELSISNIDDNEYILEVKKYPLEKVKEMIKSNQIQCGATLATLNLLFIKKGL